VAAKNYASVEESAKQAIVVQDRVSPRAEHVKTYDRTYQIYRNLYPAVRELSHQLASLSG
jgi:xylulokinase